MVSDADETVDLVQELIAQLTGPSAQIKEAQRLAVKLTERFAAERARPINITMWGVPRHGKTFFMYGSLARGMLVGSAAAVSTAIGELNTVGEIIARADSEKALAVAADVAANPCYHDELEAVSGLLQKAGSARQNSGVLLIIALVLITLGVSFGQAELPDRLQSIIQNEVAYLGLALAVVAYFKDRKLSLE